MLWTLLGRTPPPSDHQALCVADQACSYGELNSHLAEEHARLEAAGVMPGEVVTLEGPLSAHGVARLAALLARQAIVVPLAPESLSQRETFAEIAQVSRRITTAAGDALPTARADRALHPWYTELRRRGHPGLVLFSSGSTGEPKGAVHDAARLLEKFATPRPALRTVVFLQPDHIGGINTLWHTLANGGTLIVPADRSPAAVCRAIARHRAELLPTSPSFLNFLLLSGELARHDLSSLRLITYGTEPMPPSTLARVHEVLPQVRLQQTYGLTELGILRSQSRGDDSLWVRVGGEGFEAKVVDGRLWIRARSAMLGYLNAPSPFDAQGFFDTGDAVEVDGPWLRILGRASELINVGGQKVFPAEVESALVALDHVAEAAVFAQSHPLVGQIVVARVVLARPEGAAEFKARMRRELAPRLADYKIPARVELVSELTYSPRFKKLRQPQPHG